MSETLAAAAAALGLPEALVERSAAARAAEIGADVEAVLTEWAGGESAPVSAPPPAAPTETAETQPETPSPTVAAAVAEVEPPSEVPEPTPVAAGPYEPPVLVGVSDNPMLVLVGAVVLFIVVALVGLVGPAVPTEAPGARSSDISYSQAALDGQQVYLESGCAACHTQMVRPVIADVGLGAVTLDDTNQVLGTRRFGPDLSDAGTRLTQEEVGLIVGGGGGHPSSSLGADDLSNLVTYLVESQTTVAQEGS